MPIFDDLYYVNQMLSLIGESPVNTLDDSVLSEATLAHTKLIETSAEVQSRGWWCNRVYQMLAPDVDGKIMVPPTALRVDAVDRNNPVVRRGQYLYNPITNTDKFDRPIDCRLVLLLDFADLPMTLKRYIYIKAARRFLNLVKPEAIKYQITEKEELEAKIELLRDETSTDGLSLYDNPVSRSILRMEKPLCRS